MTSLLMSFPPISISHRLFRCRYSNSRDVVVRSPSFSRPAAGAPWRACSQARIPSAESQRKKNSWILESGWPYVGQNHLAQWNKPSIMKSSISSVPILSSLQRSSKLTSDVDSPSDMKVKTRILCTLFSWDKPGKEIKDMDVPLSYFASYYEYIKWFTVISPPNHLAISQRNRHQEVATKE